MTHGRPVSMNDCESIVRRLWPLLDGTLPETERVIVVAHLAGCTECRSHVDFARAFLEVVHRARPSGAGDERLRARVLAALKDDGYLTSAQ